MDPIRNAHATKSSPASAGRRPWGAAVLMVVLIAAFHLLREHGGHIARYWPYLMLVACPLMHLVHGRGRHGRSRWHGHPPRQA